MEDNNGNQTLNAHYENPEEIVAASLQILKEAGFKITQKRREIIEIFANEQSYHKAKEIYSYLAEKYPTMSYNTTYRNLYDFVDYGILETTEYQQEQLFRIACNHDHNHHHHFICTSCGMTIALDICPMNLLGDSLNDVQVDSHRFEVFGLCQACLGQASQ